MTAAPGTTLVKVDTSVRHQSFEGWGTSLCWWANKVGGWSPEARNAVVDAVVNPTTGLGYTIFRYNIGGGENPSHEHMGEFREMPGFSPSQGVWDWDADANQRAILRRIVETGENVILEAFSNSPPYWMTKSGCASGSADGSNNLKDDAYDDFADYLTEVVAHYRDTYGIVFRTLEPLNEPNANWWKSNGSQEGCHFSPSNQERIIREVAAKLAQKGLTETTVSAADENSMDDAYNNMRGFSAETFAAIGQINVHSYAGSKRAEVRELATSKGKRLWQSESGPLGQNINGDIEAALFMAGRIIQDLRELQPEAWLDWQVADPSRSWASLWLDDAAQTFMPLKRFYMHAGFSRFIRPGAVFVDVDHRDMVAALSADSRTVTIVVRNGDTMASKGFTFDLTALPSVGTAVQVHRTSRTENLAPLDPIPIQNFSFVATLPAFSVTTFVVALQ
nr:MAG: alpha-L-arabinofuranosidase [Pseudomonadota bacterium]